MAFLLHLLLLGNVALHFQKKSTYFFFQGGEISDAVAGAAKIGLDATQEVARIGIQAASAAPSILNQKLELAQGLGKTVSDTSGLVKKVFLQNDYCHDKNEIMVSQTF